MLADNSDVGFELQMKREKKEKEKKNTNTVRYTFDMKWISGTGGPGK